MSNIRVMSMAMENENPPIWNEPTQSRSREKVSRLLDAALALAVEQGSLDIKITEVAKRASVPIGSLYQFFPTRTSLIAKLFAREMQPIDEAVGAALTGARSLADLKDRIEAALSDTLRLVRSKPGLSVIWASASMDPAIEAADFANTRQNAQVLAEHMARFLPNEVDESRIQATTLLICHLWGSIVRLCILSDPQEERALLQEYSSMLALQGKSLADDL